MLDGENDRIEQAARQIVGQREYIFVLRQRDIGSRWPSPTLMNGPPEFRSRNLISGITTRKESNHE